MDVSARDWKKYIDQLAAIDDRAGDLMREWIEKNGIGDIQAMADYAYALVQKYGEGSAALSAEMYDAMAEAQGVTLPPAIPAEPAGYGEVAKTMHGIRKHSQNPESFAGGVSRLVKRTGADTTLNNALRDGAEFAWVPNGDTCAFCIALASRGWQHMSKNALKNGHAEHIHANCDCTYAIRFGNNNGVAGYNPDKYKRMYFGAEGGTPREKINSMRRELSSKDATKAADYSSKASAIEADARKNEPAITRTLMETGKETGGKLRGLENRFKGHDRIREKLELEPDKKVRDALRYTFEVSEDNYTHDYHRIIENLERKGYNISAVKNSWIDVFNPYNGINTNIVSTGDYEFEVQFHTEASLTARDKMHGLYELQRKLADPYSEEYIALTDKMFEIAKGVKIPEGVNELK